MYLYHYYYSQDNSVSAGHLGSNYHVDDHLAADHLVISCFSAIHPTTARPDHPDDGRFANGSTSTGHPVGDNPAASHPVDDCPVADNPAGSRPVDGHLIADNHAASCPDVDNQAVGHTAANHLDIKVRLSRIVLS